MIETSINITISLNNRRIFSEAGRSIIRGIRILHTNLSNYHQEDVIPRNTAEMPSHFAK